MPKTFDECMDSVLDGERGEDLRDLRDAWEVRDRARAELADHEAQKSTRDYPPHWLRHMTAACRRILGHEEGEA